ncbi:hypothetical protein MLD38_009060 [Melastoma candidum]|uniref:Uncharacterized protein n=1 Tax=Melastoma candidum TaxID=119954 RepID=A0ACB9S0P0_9MYRT|nr:hypothetical protein MLD38_009060 [Melastoma candidum]
MDYGAVTEFVRCEVPDWGDDVMSAARFKAFSGQRSDWEHKYVFRKELIVKVTRRFGILAVNVAEVKEWLSRGGLTPLCIDHDDLILISSLKDRASQAIKELSKSS